MYLLSSAAGTSTTDGPGLTGAGGQTVVIKRSRPGVMGGVGTSVSSYAIRSVPSAAEPADMLALQDSMGFWEVRPRSSRA